jgi:hypothetical protein
VVLELELTLIAFISATSHDELLLVRRVESLPNALRCDVFVFVVEGLAGSSGKIFNGFVRLAPHYVLVAAIGLSVGLFKQKHPKFLIPSSSSTEHHSFSVRFYWNVAIDFDQLPYSVKTEPDQEVPAFEVIVLKQPLDKSIVLC